MSGMKSAIYNVGFRFMSGLTLATLMEGGNQDTFAQNNHFLIEHRIGAGVVSKTESVSTRGEGNSDAGQWGPLCSGGECVGECWI